LNLGIDRYLGVARHHRPIDSLSNPWPNKAMKLFMLGKKTRSFHVYQMCADEDYFYIHPNSVLLGFFGAVMAILLLLMFATWIGYKIW
jgi:hypothetical protein